MRSETRVHDFGLSWSSQMFRDRSLGNVVVVREGRRVVHNFAVSSLFIGSGRSRFMQEAKGRRRVI
jgi:hypothetical protein